MENAAEALKMAAAVLIFVLALSITINAFGETRVVTQKILEYKDREYNYSYVDDQGGSTERIVYINDIIPTIYKAYRENYKVIFDSSLQGPLFGNEGLYRKKVKGSWNDIWYIDLQNETLGSEEDKARVLTAILYGWNTPESVINKNFTFTFEPVTSANELRNSKSIEFLHSDGLYGILKTSTIKIKETTGIYYQEEVKTEDDATTTSGSGTSSGAPTDDSGMEVPDANKTEKRVIRYSMAN